jgi:tRNA nucleotidyltransferase (CCA-adding enzyme)
VDVAVEGDGIAFAEELARRTGSKVEAFSRFGSSIVVIPGFGKVDVATARTESYERPGALPRVEKSGIERDLYRRDFTINAMALSLSPGSFLELLDPFGGREDLKKGRVRALHEKSFVDDPTRIFRAVRFEQRFRNRIESKTQSWLLKAVRKNTLRKVSGERLRNEIKLLFREPVPERAVLRLKELGVLPRLHPSLDLTKKAGGILPQIAPALAVFHQKKIVLEDEGMVWFQVFLLKAKPGQIPGLSKRLMLSRAEQAVISQSKKAYPAVLKEMSSSQGGLKNSRLHLLFGPLRTEVKCFLYAAASKDSQKRLVRYLELLRQTVPWIRGRDLKTLGIPPGFRYSFIILEALNRQLDGELRTRSEALSWVKKNYIL